MTCGNCPNTDGLCYTSLPPKVRCNITGEYHYYDDECTCKKDPVELKQELENLKELLDKPGALVAFNYDSDKAPAVTITGEEAAVAYESLLNLPMYGETASGNATIDVPVAVGSTKCLVCGDDIIVNMWDSYTQICPTCKKVIKFIKEKFKTELELL